MSSSTDSEAQMPRPIAILGAGIAGLTLGRCLRRKGIPSVIYDRASSVPRHSYGITLEPRAYKPLLEALNIDEHTFMKQLAVDNIGTGKVSSGDTGGSTAFRANRSRLESMLREGQTIRTNHVLTSASIMDDTGWIELRFESDTTIRVPQVVDALGVHSPLRKSLLPNVTPDVEPFAVYSGKRYVQTHIFNSIYAPAFGDGNTIVRNPQKEGEPRLEISVNEHKPDGTVSISYIYSRTAQNHTSNLDLLHRPNRTNAGATDIPEEFYNELQQFMTSHNFDKHFRKCFDVNQILDERVLHWLMRTAIVTKQDLLRLLEHGIVVIGDAAHAVPILGGHGANMAILDAIKLADPLTDQNGEIRQLHEFYESEWQAWNDAVELSKRGLAEMHSAPSTGTATSNL
jgi:2-polyprenyl-6-methoxyphenol hydroxylase-like FAD-dependent oxidoreductase